MLAALKRDWKAILLQAVVSAVVFLALIMILAYGLGGPQREEEVRQDVRSVRVLICKALAQAENPDIVQVIHEECEGV